MHAIDASKFDLNLLVALDALLVEGQVTRAARRVAIGQPAMSHALRRLRELLGDPLLVRSSGGMVRTPRAEALRQPLRRALAELGRVLSEDTRFEARASERTFALACPDLLAPALPDVLGAMTAEAPSVRLEVRSTEADVASVDVALAPAPREGPGQRMRALGELHWVVLARGDHPARRRFDAAAWVRYPHVQVRVGNPGPSLVDRALARAGLERRIGVVVPGFLVAPEVVARTDCFFAAPRELVVELAARFGLAMMRPPLSVPPVPVAMVWHERMQADPAHAWFRGLVGEVMSRLLSKGRAKRRVGREAQHAD